MTLLSFSLNRDKIESGAKSHTIRFRVNPPRVGEDLFLWWKSRTKDRDLMGVSVCKRVDKIIVDSESESVSINGKKLTEKGLKKLAIADGFSTIEDFWLFFPNNAEGWLIWWEADYITKRRILPEVKVYVEFESDIINQPTKHYYPRNGEEGRYFYHSFCGECSRNKSCFVFLKGMNDGTSKHWIIHEDSPTCTVFTTKKKTLTDKISAHHRQLEKNGQLCLAL